MQKKSNLLLKTKKEAFEPSALRTKEAQTHQEDAPKHIFVFGTSVRTPDIQKARKVAQACSDLIIRPSLPFYYGSLNQTLSYFQDETGLFQAVQKVFQNTETGQQNEPWQTAVAKKNLPQVVFASNLLRGFLYALQTPREGVHFALPHNIAYRRFLEKIEWDDWLKGCLEFVSLLDLSPSEKKKESAHLKSLADRMKEMRFEKPLALSHEIKQDPTLLRDVLRRFGKVSTWLWHMWTEQPTDFQAFSFQKVPEDLHPYDFEITLNNTSYGLFPSLSLEELEGASKELFFTCLTKVSSHSTALTEYGLRDFQFIVTFNDNISIKRFVSFTGPVFERTPLSEALLARVCENMISQNLIKEDGQLSLKSPCDSAPEQASEVRRFLTHIESAQVIPVEIHSRARCLNTLFAEDSGVAELQEFAQLLTVRDGCFASVYEVAPSLEPLLSFSLQNSSPERKDVYLSAHWQRPPCLLREPLEIRLNEFLKSEPFSRILYSETVGKNDYFIGFLANGKINLWLSSPTESRPCPALERPYFIVGFFDGEFSAW